MATTVVHTRQARQRRISELDALRGIALLGILLVNASVMASPYGSAGFGRPDASALDRGVEAAVQVVFVGKFYLLFSFIFGYSFTLQQTSAERDGARAVPRLLRRAAGLVALGAVHAVFLYVGDILVTYGLLMLILIAARHCSPGGALRAAKIVYGCASGLLLFLGAVSLLVPDGEGAAWDAELAAESRELIAGYRGDALSVVHTNIGQLPDSLLALLLMGGLVTAAFLVGLHCGKRRLLDDAGLHRDRMRRILLTGTLVGLPGSLFMALADGGAFGDRWVLPGQMAGMVTAPALTAAYVCGMLLFLETARGHRVTALLAPAGRMALTNYLSQSLCMALVFTGYGLALYDRLGPAAVAAGALVLFTGQLLLSAWLMRHFRHGPVEWLLRTLTLARRPGTPHRTDAPG
ncbi:DUF418 domain-containing protein [Streptomyces sp. bgisy100]|uniref:DUF418 domain-containing protein n=1 Tax=Streptomyces sp. bgisy100 TaxID=3413783 RepID=UPI003D71A548